ncbi:primosomal protein N' [Anaerotignum lactatifermentans]|uniref:Replication restart protein PriA n=1 Tax=Anaerotignum lactatifermentans TaxID=160404 RepID=A0A1Y3UDB1_9FIRM|nr:primosomal protein N' [Anaerotignum lactatifermentans]OUN45087.1 primosomal protein N' [Anaerotignum lactatifermentans]
MYAQVIIDANHAEVDRVFDYRVPAQWEEEVCVGLRVMVPFGQRNTKREGYVIALTETTEVHEGKIKGIVEILDEGRPILTPSILELAKWMKKEYFCTLNQCLQAVMPAGIRTKSVWYAELTGQTAELSEKEQQMADVLEEQGGAVPLRELEQIFGNRTEYILRCLQEKKVVRLHQKTTRSTYKKEKRYVSLTENEELLIAAKEKAEKDKRLAGQLRVLSAISQGESLSVEELKEKAAVTDSPIHTLLQKGVLVEQRRQEKRDVFQLEDYTPTQPFYPTPEQAQALTLLREEEQKAQKRPVLLHGVTGSGKTEIYMQLIEHVIMAGKQAIVLVPEISLTPQIMERFISRFGKRVSVTHSRLSLGERLDQWRKARDGEISIIIGPRSALFMPFSNLGVIVMDECHESSYISDVTPKYHTREVARKLSELTGALLVMGSATPDIDSYHRAVTGEFLLLQLKERTKGSHLPEVFVTDMRKELEDGNRSAFGLPLQQAIRENLEKRQQTMLFLNRRGYSTFVSCRKCGEALTCPSCNVSYTYHASDKALVCHYCGKEVPVPKTCPSCGSHYIRYFGTGTQKIEEETRRLFPEASVLRMDADTTTGKNGHARILELFGKGKADILIGTQMIAKGHDFPNVTLVGILAADLSLNLGTYQAAETCFQLITQAAGRAGRGELAGRVFIQTYQPENHAIRMAAAQDYEGFYQEEILLRQAMEYPPFSHIFSVLITGEMEQEVILAAQRLGAYMNHYAERAGCTVVGPAPAPLPKFRGEFRWQIFAKGTDADRLKAFVLYTVEQTKKDVSREIRFHLAFLA